MSPCIYSISTLTFSGRTPRSSNTSSRVKALSPTLPFFLSSKTLVWGSVYKN